MSLSQYDSSRVEYEPNVSLTCAFSSYIAVSCLSFLVYSASFTFVCSKKVSQQFDKTILFLLAWPIVANLACFVDSCVGTASYLQGDNIPGHNMIEYAMAATMLVNLTVLNFFQLKIAGIAAILK